MTHIVPKTAAAARFLAALPSGVRAEIAAHGVAIEGSPEAAAALAAPPEQLDKPPRAKRRPNTRPQSAEASYRERRARRKQKQLSRRERQREQLAAREQRLLERVSARIAAAGGDTTPPPLIPIKVWRVAWQIVGDPSGAAARVHLRAMHNRAAAGAIIAAALGDDEITAERSWAQPRTRKIAALGVALVLLAEPTRRRGRWQGIVRGIYQGAFAAMLHDPFDTRAADGSRYKNGRPRKRPGTPHIRTVFGRDVDEPGYFAELVRAGLVYAQQLPAHLVRADEKNGPSGHATNRYWVVSGDPESQIDDQAAQELCRLIEAAAAVCRVWAREHRRRRDRADGADGPPPIG